MTKLIRLAHGFMAVLFAFSATLQYNDPEPAPWILLYTAAAIVSGFAAKGRSTGWLAPALVLVCAWWEIHYIRLGAYATPLSHLAEEWHMTDQSVVDGREFYGLILIATWMGVVFLTRPREPESPDTP